MHSWDSIPEKWECQGQPPAGTTIDLRVALKPQRENALIDALYEISDPGHSKYVTIPLFLYVNLLIYICVVLDTVRTYPRSKSPSSSLRIQTHSNSSVPGLNTTRFRPLRSRSHMAGAG
jgi:hypothetical protein